MYKKRQEVINLQKKVNQLQDLIRQLGEYIGWEGVSKLTLADGDFSESNLNLVEEDHKESQVQGRNFHNVETVNSNAFATSSNYLHIHKDILIDDDSIQPDLSNHGHYQNSISCEEQVYRLTAQLTAAYHRIAFLEDQLLAIRSDLDTRNNGFYHVQ